MELPASTAINAAMARQNMTMSVIKHNAEQGKAIAKILDDATRRAPTHSSRGGNLNVSA